MWITGVFGIATKYVEVFASVKYRVRDHAGTMLGGAMYVWERGFKRADGSTPWWAKTGAAAFAAFAVVATVGTGSAVQASAMTGIIAANAPGVPVWLIGIVIVVLVAVVIFGGVKTIAAVCERLVPVMAVAYAGGCIVILALNASVLGEAIGLIFETAFTGKAAFGGAVGSGVMTALQFGCARGLFSNESGLGSAPIVAAAAKTRNPAEQALVAMTGTFWSTVVICALTGIVLVSTMIANPGIQADVLANPTFYTGAELASAAFANDPATSARPSWWWAWWRSRTPPSSGWSYYGNRCAAYLFGKRGVRPYQVVYVAVAFLGAIGVGNVVWTVSRHRQRAHGRAQHRGHPASVGRGRARDAALRLRRPPGRGGRDAHTPGGKQVAPAAPAGRVADLRTGGSCPAPGDVLARASPRPALALPGRLCCGFVRRWRLPSA